MTLASWSMSTRRIRGISEAASESLAHAAFWAGAARITSQVVTWVATLIVARLLTPEDFGLVGMAQVFLALVTIFTEFGLGTAIVAHPEMTERQGGQLNTVSLLVSVVAVAITCAAAAPLGWFFMAPQLPVVVVVTSVIFAINGFRIVPNAMLQREFKFRYLAIVDAIASMVVAGAMIGFAALGLQYWTLVIGTVLGSSVATLLTVVARPCPLVRPRLREVSSLLSVSRQLLIARLVWWVQSNSDAVIIGRWLGKGPLGAFTMTTAIASLPVDKITSLANQVSPPFLSAVRDDRSALRHQLLVLTGVVAFVVFPIAAGLAVVATNFVLVALGTKWITIIPALRFLSILAAFRSVQSLLSPAVVVTGGTRPFMYLSLIEAGVMVLTFYVGSSFGITGIALGWLLVHPVMRLPVYAWIFRSTGMTLGEYLSVLRPSLYGTALMVVGVLSLNALVPADWSTAARLVIQVGAGVVIYGVVSFLQRHRLWRLYAEFRTLGRAMAPRELSMDTVIS